MPEATWRMAEHNMCAATRIRLNQILRLASWLAPCRVADLGCGTGQISHALMDIGCDVTAVDDSAGRIMPSIGHVFVKADATHYHIDSAVEVVVCAGLLYHLDVASQVRLVANIGDRLVILDTHFSRHPDVTIGGYSGQYRDPTTSTRVNQAFVHSLPSLKTLFVNHYFIEPFRRVTMDRKVMLLVPRNHRGSRHPRPKRQAEIRDQYRHE